MTQLARVLREYMNQESLNRLEGRRGVVNLCKIVAALGYKDPLYFGQLESNATLGDLIQFLEDNPGAIEAIIKWIGETNSPEWRDELELSTEDGEFDEEDDVNDDNED